MMGDIHLRESSIQMKQVCSGNECHQEHSYLRMKKQQANQRYRRLTLLLGDNSAGDFKLKPLLVYKSETPRAMKNNSKNSLTVVWMSNKTAWITSKLFKDWFKINFCPKIKNTAKKIICPTKYCYIWAILKATP